jgi:cytochrome P450
MAGAANQAGSFPLVDFDYRRDPALLEQGWRRWDELREAHPVFAVPFEDRHVWICAGYDAVHDAARAYETFSSRTLDVFGPKKLPEQRIIPAEIDPPLHSDYRQMVLRDFAPAAIDAMQDQLREFASDLIDELVPRGECDFITDFAKRFPTEIFMLMMGLPIEKSQWMIERSDTVLHHRGTPEDLERAAAAQAEIEVLLSELIADRRAEPRDDLMSRIVESDIDGRPISDTEIRNYSYTLYLGGLDTVAMQLGHMFSFLANNDGHRQQIIDDPSIIPGASEEMLRAFPILTTGRVVTEDIEFHGCPMKKGDRLLFSTVAASRDSSQFPNPYAIDFRRSPNRHLSFGAGPHRCLGSNLARSELVIALQEWHRRIPNYQIGGDGTVHYHGGAILGLDALPLVWNT